MPEQFLDVGPDRLWYDDSGGEGIPFVLLHPGITDSRVWDRMLPHLGPTRVIRFDRRGFGRSPRASEPYRALDDLISLLDALGLEQVHLVGNSMGGETSLALAIAEAGRVASMTLLCPGIGGYPWPEEEDNDPDLEARWIAAKEAGDLPGLASVQLEYWCASGTDEYLEEVVLRATELDHSEAAGLEQENPPQWELAAHLRVPTTVIAAELDPPESMQASIDLAERIPEAVLVQLPVDHLPQYRDPAAVAEVVLATVARG
ncbi:MAG: alpha/beta fold hydrolase [Marmoricola sp.]